MTRSDMHHTRRVSQQLRQIPEEKRSTMYWRTAIGLVLVVVGVCARLIWKELPDLVAFGTFGFGMVMASGQLMAHPFKLFTAMVRDIFAATKGRTE